jgi:hypothetical protein
MRRTAPSRRQDEAAEPSPDVIGLAVAEDERDAAGGLERSVGSDPGEQQALGPSPLGRRPVGHNERLDASMLVFDPGAAAGARQIAAAEPLGDQANESGNVLPRGQAASVSEPRGRRGGLPSPSVDRRTLATASSRGSTDSVVRRGPHSSISSASPARPRTPLPRGSGSGSSFSRGARSCLRRVRAGALLEAETKGPASPGRPQGCLSAPSNPRRGCYPRTPK